MLGRAKFGSGGYLFDEGIRRGYPATDTSSRTCSTTDDVGMTLDNAGAGHDDGPSPLVSDGRKSLHSLAPRVRLPKPGPGRGRPGRAEGDGAVPRPSSRRRPGEARRSTGSTATTSSTGRSTRWSSGTRTGPRPTPTDGSALAPARAGRGPARPGRLGRRRAPRGRAAPARRPAPALLPRPGARPRRPARHGGRRLRAGADQEAVADRPAGDLPGPRPGPPAGPADRQGAGGLGQARGDLPRRHPRPRADRRRARRGRPAGAGPRQVRGARQGRQGRVPQGPVHPRRRPS